MCLKVTVYRCVHKVFSAGVFIRACPQTCLCGTIQVCISRGVSLVGSTGAGLHTGLLKVPMPRHARSNPSPKVRPRISCRTPERGRPSSMCETTLCLQRNPQLETHPLSSLGSQNRTFLRSRLLLNWCPLVPLDVMYRV